MRGGGILLSQDNIATDPFPGVPSQNQRGVDNGTPSSNTWDGAGSRLELAAVQSDVKPYASL